MQFDTSGNHLLILPETPADFGRLDKYMSENHPTIHSLTRTSDKSGQDWFGKYYLEVFCTAEEAATIKKDLLA